MSHVFHSSNMKWAGYAKSPKPHRHHNSSESFAKMMANKRLRGTPSPQSTPSHQTTFLDDYTVSNLVAAKEWQGIKTVSDSDTLCKVIETLYIWRTTMAVVKNESSGELIGTIYIIDLVSMCYAKISKERSDRYENAKELCREEFKNTTVKEYLAQSCRNRFATISLRAPLSELITLFSESHTKHVVVMRESYYSTVAATAGSPRIMDDSKLDDIAAIVSQHQVVHYLLDILPESMKSLPVGDYLCPAKKAEVAASDGVGETQTVKNDYVVGLTFNKIWNKQCTGVADIQGYCVLDKFLNWLVHIIYADLPVEAVTVSEKDTMEDLLTVLTSNNVRKALVVNDEDRTPVGTVELRDLMKRLPQSLLSVDDSKTRAQVGGTPPTK